MSGPPRIPRRGHVPPRPLPEPHGFEFPSSPSIDPLFTRMDWIKFALGAVLGVSAALALGVCLRASLLAIPVPEPVVVAPEFTCPAPAKPGQVTTITWRNDAGRISTKCQLINDWQLLNPKGANKP